MARTDTRRKIIDLPEAAVRSLSFLAVQNGGNFKNYVEQLLIQKAEEVDEDAILIALSSTPKALAPLSESRAAKLREKIRKA